jgi:hypothetical protein
MFDGFAALLCRWLRWATSMMRGHFTKLSERKPMDCLARLAYDIEIKVRPTKSDVGHLMFAAA